MTRIARCKFCNQERTIICGEETTEEEAINIATDECNCEEAMTWQTKKDAVTTAQGWVDAQEDFGPATKEYFKASIDKVVDELVDSVTIKKGTMTYTIKRGTKGVKINQKETINKAMEF